ARPRARKRARGWWKPRPRARTGRRRARDTRAAAARRGPARRTRAGPAERPCAILPGWASGPSVGQSRGGGARQVVQQRAVRVDVGGRHAPRGGEQVLVAGG